MLEEADDVFIIGFSFPPTDITVRFLFQTALNPQADVHIIDISDENTLKESHKINLDTQCIKGGNFATDVRFAARSSISASADILLRSPEDTSLDFVLASEFSPRNGTSIGGFGKAQWTF